MSNLKELTWEHHKNAERQAFVKEMFAKETQISRERYACYLFNQYKQYQALETVAKDLFTDMPELPRASNIYTDYKELWEISTEPPLMPVVAEYIDYLDSIKHDHNKLMAHIYVRHMGDLSGGQMISKRVPGSGKFYQFDRPVDELKELVRSKLNDDMADEAKICFDFATKMFMQLGETK
jgi:heme oxygenase